MSYRMDSPKRATISWGYKLDYDKEISQDEQQIAYLSSDFAKAVAANVDALLAKGQDWALSCGIDSLLYACPDLLPFTGLSVDEARAFYSVTEFNAEAEAVLLERYGAPQPGDYRLGCEIWEKRLSPEGFAWGDFRSFRESGRAEMLRKAKAALSRHRRNKAKNE